MSLMAFLTLINVCINFAFLVIKILEYRDNHRKK